MTADKVLCYEILKCAVAACKGQTDFWNVSLELGPETEGYACSTEFLRYSSVYPSIDVGPKKKVFVSFFFTKKKEARRLFADLEQILIQSFEKARLGSGVIRTLPHGSTVGAYLPANLLHEKPNKAGAVIAAAFVRMLEIGTPIFNCAEMRYFEHLDDLERQQRLAELTAEPAPSRQVTRTEYQRHPLVVAEARRRAKGYCQLCKTKAPFQTRSDSGSFDGSYYLEVHHIIPLSDGGPDHINNVVALCPNCHRNVHDGPQQALTSDDLRRLATAD